MRKIIDRIRSISRELQRRRVYRVGTIYVVLAGGALSLVDVVQGALLLEDWILTVAFVVAVSGFPVALVVAWLYEATSSGLEREQGDTPGLRWLFAGVVVLASVTLGTVAWAFWLGPALRRDQGQALETSAVELDPARVAVLHMEDHSEDGSLGAIANGLTEGITHRLTAVEGLDVVARDGVRGFRDQEIPFRTMARSLNAGSIVDGSVQASRDSVRVILRLIDGNTASHVGSEVISHPRGELFTLLDVVTDQLLPMLRSKIGEGIRMRELRSRASSTEAWLLTHEAQQAMEEDFRALRTSDAVDGMQIVQRADSLLSVAIDLDPEWVDPYVHRGWVRFVAARLSTGAPGLDEEWISRALGDAEAALTRDPRSARALELRGTLQAAMADGLPLTREEVRRLRDAAVQDLVAAIEEDPGSGQAWMRLAQIHGARGEFLEAKEAAERAREVDAFLEVDADALMNLFAAELNLEVFPDAWITCNEGRIRFPQLGDFLLCRLMLMASDSSLQADPVAAWSAVDTLRQVTAAPMREPLTLIARANVAKILVRAGLPDSARAVLDRVEGDGEPPSWLAYDVAHAHLMMGRQDRALDLLAGFVEDRPGYRALLGRDWWFREIWDHPRFRALVSDSAPAG